MRFSWCQQLRQEEYRYFIYTCNSTARDYTQGALYGYKVVLQLATVLMAIKTRKVKILGMDDYREIILATYISSFVLMIIFIFNIFVADRINLYTMFTCLGLFVGATAIMVLVFVPKVTTNSCCFVVVVYFYLQRYNRSDQKALKYHNTNLYNPISCEEKLLYTCSYNQASMQWISLAMFHILQCSSVQLS